LLIGQPIDARELELATSAWSPDRFASMCNSLAWAVSGRQYPGVPSFTERVNSADGGIDAEWGIEVAGGDDTLPTPIIGQGWNVFQYKKRDLIAQDRGRIISNSKLGLKKALADLAKARGKTPNRYVLFLNVDLKHDQKLALKDAILEGCSRSSEVHVEVIGAAEIAAFLNNQPHLRAAYFAPVAFRTWEEANRLHHAQKLFGFAVALVGREDLLTQVRSLVDNPQARVVVVTGPHDIGKSRLALEATSHRTHEVIFALDPRSMMLNDYRNLCAPQHEVVCVVEDPDSDSVKTLANEILAIERLKLVITLPTSDQPPDAYGTDERIQSVAVGPLSDEASRKLVSATGKRLDFGVESWILDRAGGNPGILLAATSIAEKLRDAPGDFEAAVGREFARRIESRIGRDALKCAELLSPLTHVGISGHFEAELHLICKIFGDEQWHPARAISELEDLEKAGLAKRGGSFAEITIPFLANHLVTKLLSGRRSEIFALFGGLDRLGRIRFIRRLSQVTSQEVDRFWDALFDPRDPRAPFGNLRSALGQEQMLRFIAGATPERTVALLEKGLLQTSREERLAISEEPRRELMWALEQLLFRATTSGRALRLIWLLAEAENETFGNTATGVLLECFLPLHSQMPLPLDERLNALGEFTSPRASKEGKLVAIRVAGKALSQRVVGLRHSTGTAPLDKRPVLTYRDLYDYARGLVDHLFSLAETEEDEIAQAALDQLPTLVSELATQGQPKEAVEHLNKLVEWALSEKPGVSIAPLYRAIEFVRRTFESFIEKQEIVANRRNEFRSYVEDLDQLILKLESGSFSVRLKRWTSGGWHSKDHEEVTVGGKRTYKFDHALETLADEVMSNPGLLTGDVISWLVSGKAQRSNQFFFHLGRLDRNGQLRLKIEKIGTESTGGIAFGSYWRGQAEIDRKKAEIRLEQLTSSGSITSEALLAAVAHLGPSQSTLRLILDEISRGRVSPKAISEFMYGDWIRGISTEELLSLLKILAGNHLENASVAIDVLGRWIYEDRPLGGTLGDFAWQCLEASPPVSGNEVYDCDKLAAKLAQVDPDRGFKLLETLLMQPEDSRSWCPIDRYAGGNEFWNVLYGADRRRALRTVFSVALRDPLYSFRVTWNLEELLNQHADADILLEFALESESQAILVAESITNAKEGFWPIAFGIIGGYPTSPKVWDALTQGVEQMDRIIEGPYSQHIDSCRKEVEKKLSEPTTPAAARPWLRDILSRLEGESAQHVIWEYDEDANDLRRYIECEDKNSPERIWAIARVLKYADWKDIRRMLTVEDIEVALPQVDLPERKRKALEKALEVWRVGT